MVKELALLQNVLCALWHPDNVLRSIVLVDFADLLVDVFDMELLFQLFRFLFDRAFCTFHGFHPVPLIALQHKIIMPALQVEREHHAFKLHIHPHFFGHVKVVRPVLRNSKCDMAVVATRDSSCLLAEIFQASRHSAFL